ncbi:MAG: hypothetical protein U9O94_09635 [Nanoarchaeota archaeon]|nr:hypothetical protein [Nanoarchaeota archaeon]
MIDKTNFNKVKKEMQNYDKQRELVVRKSRDIIRLSKELIYSIHRNDMRNAQRLKKDIDKELERLNKLAKNRKLQSEGSVKVAIMEYIEAIAYLKFVKNKKIPTFNKNYIDIDYYLMGLCDLTGELTRRAVNSAIKEDYKGVKEIKELVENIYGLFIQLDIRGNELRRKFDSIKWDLKKLEDLVCELKLKGKL